MVGEDADFWIFWERLGTGEFLATDYHGLSRTITDYYGWGGVK